MLEIHNTEHHSPAAVKELLALAVGRPEPEYLQKILDRFYSAAGHTLFLTLDKDKIIVVRNDECDENIKKAGRGFDGNFDHIELVLSTLGVSHTLVGKSELAKDSFDWNCLLSI